jgi:PIN domain nuclease of toxin-antitoxin system
VGKKRVKLLIDTHILFWWLTDDKQLTATARKAIANPEATVFVSAVSIWEMAIKVKIGKWPEAASLLENYRVELQAERFEALPITLKHAKAAGLLNWDHKDPFDRMLAAQAEQEELTLVSADSAFQQATRLKVLW